MRAAGTATPRSRSERRRRTGKARARRCDEREHPSDQGKRKESAFQLHTIKILHHAGIFVRQDVAMIDGLSCEFFEPRDENRVGDEQRLDCLAPDEVTWKELSSTRVSAPRLNATIDVTTKRLRFKAISSERARSRQRGANRMAPSRRMTSPLSI